MQIIQKRNGHSYRCSIRASIVVLCLFIGSIWRIWVSSSSTRDVIPLLDYFLGDGRQETALVVPNEEDDNEDNEDAAWKRYDENRTIVFVHVGKAAGMTIRRATSLRCRLAVALYKTQANVQRCIHRRFLQRAVLSRQVQYYFHMHGYNKEEIEASTSFLIPLRNPVDRIISTYRYSHPRNCNKKEYEHQVIRPWGCEAAKRWKRKEAKEYQVYTICFPSAAMEQFAQSVMSPWSSNSNYQPWSQQHFNNKTLAITTTKTQEGQTNQECRWLARQMVQGRGPMWPAPHMFYNYNYYAEKTLDEFPSKEVFGVRTGHTWDDLQHLDLAIGGVGKFLQDGRDVSHGSEGYEDSPLSEEAYQKLCCVLEHEIALYLDIVDRVWNLSDNAKRGCREEVKTKCRIITSWDEWRQACKARLDEDDRILAPPKKASRLADAFPPGNRTKS